jgi:hypothetical protein
VVGNISAEAGETRPDAEKEVAEDEHAFVAQDIAHATGDQNEGADCE